MSTSAVCARFRKRFPHHELENQKQGKGGRSPAEWMLSEGCDSKTADAPSLVPAYSAHSSTYPVYGAGMEGPGTCCSGTKLIGLT